MPDALTGAGILKLDAVGEKHLGQVSLRPQSEARAHFSKDDYYLSHLPLNILLLRWLGPLKSLLDTLETWLPEWKKFKFVDTYLSDQGPIPSSKIQDVVHEILNEYKHGLYLRNRIARRRLKLFSAAVFTRIPDKNAFSEEFLANPLQFLRNGSGFSDLINRAFEGNLSRNTDDDKDIQDTKTSMGRVLRCFMLFVDGISSRLPALIHLEIANHLYPRRESTTVPKASGAQRLFLRLSVYLIFGEVSSFPC